MSVHIDVLDICFISVPNRFEQVCEDQDTSQCGLASCLVGLTRCWWNQTSAEFANLLDIAETPAHPFCRGWGYSVQLCFSKGTDLIVIFDVQHLQVTRTELHSKLLAWHSLVCLVTSAEPLHRKVRYDWLGSFRPEAVWLASCSVTAKTCFGIVGSCCDACR